MIKACIFDCDGTLLDTLVSIAYSANRALKDYDLKEIAVEEYKYLVGDGAYELIRRCLKRNGEDKLQLFEPVFARYMEYFKKDCMYQVKPYEGILELLTSLRMAGIKTAVLSNKPDVQTQKVIKECFAEDTFDKILGFIDGIPKKPAPDGALTIAKALDVQPEECLYIGDTDTDMQTGNRAGMITVGVLWGFREKEELRANGAKYLAAEPREILGYLKN